MARPKMNEKDKKIHTAFRLSKERLDQLDMLVLFYMEEKGIDSINRTTVIDLLIKDTYEHLDKAGEFD